MIKETLISSMAAEKTLPTDVIRAFQFPQHVRRCNQTTGHAVEQSGIKGRHIGVCNHNMNHSVCKDFESELKLQTCACSESPDGGRS